VTHHFSPVFRLILIPASRRERIPPADNAQAESFLA